MTIQLYRNISTAERVNKSITAVGSALTGTIKEESSIIDPVITIAAQNLPDANYLYITEFKRYYYINNIVCDYDGMFQIEAHVDVLMSNAATIRQQRAIVAKQQNRYNLYLNDPDYRTYSDPWIITREFPSGFSDPCYLLTLRGGHT
jgi:hypothetical protein